MLAKVCITSPDSRHTLSAEIYTFLELNPIAEDLSPKQSKLKLKKLYDRETPPLLTYTDIVITGVLHELQNFTDEADWVRLALAWDKCDETARDSRIFATLEGMVFSTPRAPMITINAYYFFRSQNQKISQHLLTEEIAPAILALENAEAQTAAWAILLSDPHCPEDIVSTFNAEQNLEILSAVIPWTAKNNKGSLTSVMAHFIALQNPELTLALIRLSFNGTIKLEILKEALQSSRAFEGHPEFSIVFFAKNLAASGENGQELIRVALENLNEIITDEPSEEKLLEKKEALFKLFIAPALKTHPQYLLYSADKILSSHSYLLGEFAKLASAMEVNQETVQWLSNAVVHLAQSWELEPALQALNIETEILGKSPNAAQNIRKDLTKSATRDIIGKIIFILTIPGVWDQIVQKYDGLFLSALENILLNDTKDFFRSITLLPWQQNNTGQRICSDATIDWLFSLPHMNSLNFIQPDDSSFSANGEVYITNLIMFNDIYVIKKLFSINAKLGSSVLFTALTKSTTFEKGLINAILPLLTHPDFHIEHYYEHASEAFKQLPQVKAAMQLQYFFHPETVAHLVGGDSAITNIEVTHHPETFFHALKYRHSDDLFAMTKTLATLDLSANRELYEKARSLHKQIKKLRPEAKIDLNDDIRFSTFSLAHRKLKDESVDETENKTKQAVRSVKGAFNGVLKGHKLTGKKVKVPFLQYILDHLIQYQACLSENTNYRQAPFIWSVYVEAYLKQKRLEQKRTLTSDDQRFLPEKMVKVNEWLKDQILDGKKTKETLGLLPEPLLNAIFNCTYVEADIKELRAIGERLLVDTSSDDGDNDSESKQEMTAVVTPSSHFFSRRPSLLSSGAKRASLDSEKPSLFARESDQPSFSTQDFWAEVRNPQTVDSSLSAYPGSMHFTSTGPVAVGAPSASAVAVGKL